MKPIHRYTREEFAEHYRHYGTIRSCQPCREMDLNKDLEGAVVTALEAMQVTTREAELDELQRQVLRDVRSDDRATGIDQLVAYLTLGVVSGTVLWQTHDWLAWIGCMVSLAWLFTYNTGNWDAEDADA